MKSFTTSLVTRQGALFFEAGYHPTLPSYVKILRFCQSWGESCQMFGSHEAWYGASIKSARLDLELCGAILSLIIKHP